MLISESFPSTPGVSKAKDNSASHNQLYYHQF